MALEETTLKGINRALHQSKHGDFHANKGNKKFNYITNSRYDGDILDPNYEWNNNSGINHIGKPMVHL